MGSSSATTTRMWWHLSSSYSQFHTRSPRAQFRCIFRLACQLEMVFSSGRMSLLPTADLLALDISGLKRRLSMLRRYL